MTMLADTIRLQPEATGTKVSAIDVEYLKEPNRDGPARMDPRISYELKGESIEITDLCGPLELCAPPPHWTGRVTVDELRLDGIPGPYVYSRID